MPLTQPTAARPFANRSSLAAALGRGGVGGPITRAELWALLRGVADAQTLTDADGSGTRLATTVGLDDAAAVRGGVAILCPTRPILLPGIEPTLRLTYLAESIQAGPQGLSVDALFLILASSVAAHDALLAELTDRLDASFLALLAERPRFERLIHALGEAPLSAPAAAS